MHFIFTQKDLDSRDNRSHNVCVSSDKLWFFLSFCDISVFENYALFSFNTQTVPSQPTQPKKLFLHATHAYVIYEGITQNSP